MNKKKKRKIGTGWLGSFEFSSYMLEELQAHHREEVEWTKKFVSIEPRKIF